jgi:hypothetical protein
LRVFPVLEGAPAARSTAADLALVRQIAPDFVLLQLGTDATRPAALDSIAHVLDPLRDLNVRVAVGLAVSGAPSHLDDLRRLDALERVVARLKPDVVFPALSSPLPELSGTATPSAAWWRSIEYRSKMVIDRVRPRTLLGWTASRLDATDSVVYRWAARSPSIVRVIGAIVYPSFSGLPAVDARLRTLERWRQSALATGDAPQPHWLVNVGGLPHAHGDAAQSAGIRHAIAWGNSRSWIEAVIVGEPADYDGGLGLRASNGRLRAAVGGVATMAASVRATR